MLPRIFITVVTLVLLTAMVCSCAAPTPVPKTTLKIAFTSNRDGNLEIYMMYADGSNPTNLTNNPARDEGAAWSPDGSKIAFTSDFQIYVMNADGSNLTKLTNTDWDNHAAWSPDGSRIAFTSNRDGNFEIYVMEADGSNPTNLTNNKAWDIEAVWSP